MVTYPSILAAARARVHGAVGVAKQVFMCWTTLAIRRILLALPLCRNVAEERSRARSEVLIAGVGRAGVLLGAVLSRQALSRRALEIAGRVDPMEVDVGGRETGESASGQKCGPHGWIFEQVSR